MCPIIGSLRCDHGDVNENVKGITRLGDQNDKATLHLHHAISVHFFTALHDLQYEIV